MVQVSAHRQDTCLHNTDANARWAALSTIASALTHVDSIIWEWTGKLVLGCCSGACRTKRTRATAQPAASWPLRPCVFKKSIPHAGARRRRLGCPTPFYQSRRALPLRGGTRGRAHKMKTKQDQGRSGFLGLFAQFFFLFSHHAVQAEQLPCAVDWDCRPGCG